MAGQRHKPQPTLSVVLTTLVDGQGWRLQKVIAELKKQDDPNQLVKLLEEAEECRVRAVEVIAKLLAKQ